VFAAHANLQIRPHLAAALGGDPHQLADTLAIDRHERIDLEDRLLGVVR
jgi:hypothetical protein